jgi:LPS-assembly protein
LRPAYRFEGATRARLLGGAAALVLSATSAAAQTADPAGAPAAQLEQPAQTVAPATRQSAQAPLAADPLGDKGFYLEADTLVRDDKNDVITATGQVEVRYRGRTLRTDNLRYDNKSGIVTAVGNVVVINEDGTAEFAKELTADDDMKAGVALAFSARLQQNVKIAAATAIRRNPTINELNRAIYTPCNICAQTGEPKTPTWSITADKVIQDSNRHLVVYHNAVVRAFGVPIFYAPYFWHGDPKTVRRSGLLAPRMEASNKRGFSFEQPYYQTLGKSADLLLSPLVSTKVNPFLNLEYRQRFYTGQIDVRAGLTYEQEFNNSGEKFGADTWRSYILASGAFQLDSKWQWGFSLERVSDQLLFDRYNIPDVYEKRGLFETDTRRLLSQIFAVRQDQTSYLSVSALTFQGLQLVSINPPVPENDAGFPIVAPLIEGRWQPDTDVLGGRLKLAGSAVVLTRDQSQVASTIPGVDSRRATGEVDWRRAITLSPGIRIEPFLDGRADAYSVEATTPGGSATTTLRGQATAGVDVSWPFIKRSGDTTIVLEPMIQGAVSPTARPDPNVPNEDSFELPFDETNLFDPNRVPGFDIYDNGARLNVGGRATVDWGGGRSAWVMAGKSFRADPNLMIPATSGYSQTSSDWVVAASATPMKGLSLYGRTLLDSDSLDVRRAEAGVSVLLPNVQGYLRYYYDQTDPTRPLHNLEAAADVFVTKHWGFVVYGARDIVRDVWSRRDVGLIYRDECTRIELVYHHEDISILSGGAADSVQLRLTLATLGDPGYRDHDDR